MFAIYQTAFIYSVVFVLLLPISYCQMASARRVRRANQFESRNSPTLTDDEISYALSELSVDDLKALSQLMDTIYVHDDPAAEVDDKVVLSPGEVARFKRENSDESPEKAQENSLPIVDEEYMKLLADSFPNVVDQSNQEDKSRDHIRVKRT